MINLIIMAYNFLTLTRNLDLNYCDIKGNVKNPGVYLVEEGDVINDIILKAGGLKKNSYVKNINLSKKVTDEMVIKINTIDEYEELNFECPKCECSKVECILEETSTTSTTTQVSTTLITETTSVITSTQQLLVNINTASLEELIKLPGIGGVIGNNIIEYRNEHTFEKIDDILKVKGVGEKLFEKIKNYIQV